MIYKSKSSNLERLYKNGDKKTVKDAADHFGIKIVTVDNYEDAINEITKEENGKCPYYACWIMNSDKEKNY